MEKQQQITYTRAQLNQIDDLPRIAVKLSHDALVSRADSWLAQLAKIHNLPTYEGARVWLHPR
jgi:hypothetical protein